MKVIPKTQKDFEWVNWSAKDIDKNTDRLLKKLKNDIDNIKSIPKEKRTFENTIYAIEIAGDELGEDSPIFSISYISPKKDVRESSLRNSQKFSRESVDILHDKDLYNAFKEYNPKKEKLSPEEKRLYNKMKKDFSRSGFDLSEKDQEKLKKLKKDLSAWSADFSANIANYKAHILCTEKELAGLSQTFISNLSKDKKTGKYIVTIAYPEKVPFIEKSESDKKRQELIDKASMQGGKVNIKILSKMLKARHEIALTLGYKNYAEYALEDTLAKKPETVDVFLKDNLSALKIQKDKDSSELRKFALNELGVKELKYFNTAYISTKMEEKIFDLDQNKIKEYFEMEHVRTVMMDYFSSLFSISFKRNETLPVWHKDVILFDVLDKGKTISHVGFDMYPREGKYSHMAVFWFANGGRTSFRRNVNHAPFCSMVANFPKGSKNNPSLLSYSELQTIFHEFGHMMHNALCHTKFNSESVLSSPIDFVETPSQLFENWVHDKNILKKLSKHYKTGEKLSDEVIERVIKSGKFMKASFFYRQFSISLQDFEMHTTKHDVDPLALSLEFNKRYSDIKPSPKSLFPANWGHMVGYSASYYSYMWSLVYSYDLFSRFKKEGIMNKKVGMDLRNKILAKGDSEDAMKLMKDFLGRKPNNKAFLEELGIK